MPQIGKIGKLLRKRLDLGVVEFTRCVFRGLKLNRNYSYLYIYIYIQIQSPNVSKIGALQPLEEIEKTVRMTSNDWRPGITPDNFGGGDWRS